MGVSKWRLGFLYSSFRIFEGRNLETLSYSRIMWTKWQRDYEIQTLLLCHRLYRSRRRLSHFSPECWSLQHLACSFRLESCVWKSYRTRLSLSGLAGAYRTDVVGNISCSRCSLLDCRAVQESKRSFKTNEKNQPFCTNSPCLQSTC